MESENKFSPEEYQPNEEYILPWRKHDDVMFDKDRMDYIARANNESNPEIVRTDALYKALLLEEMKLNPAEQPIEKRVMYQKLAVRVPRKIDPAIFENAWNVIKLKREGKKDSLRKILPSDR
jgi:hypothetical protein